MNYQFPLTPRSIVLLHLVLASVVVALAGSGVLDLPGEVVVAYLRLIACFAASTAREGRALPTSKKPRAGGTATSP